jgi:hypothetical protein
MECASLAEASMYRLRPAADAAYHLERGGKGPEEIMSKIGERRLGYDSVEPREPVTRQD